MPLCSFSIFSFRFGLLLVEVLGKILNVLVHFFGHIRHLPQLVGFAARTSNLDSNPDGFVHRKGVIFVNMVPLDIRVHDVIDQDEVSPGGFSGIRREACWSAAFAFA